ncbi:uncharacterized protein LOC122672488 [Telopea speciosissima]|uniref:uncharacterized protein LOC122672488 n=1 Tax=Telopea speciosissima TaxID=54955 RepID=UPI001CC3567F|nr:uncharacterized protein LOC122672488 [Telopea speciosissima]
MDDRIRRHGECQSFKEAPRIPPRSYRKPSSFGKVGLLEVSNITLVTSGSWQPNVAAWEKKFCTSVCSLPWFKIIEAKKVMSLYPNVIQWNDSAGQEAFNNAKHRFWATINGLPIDISLPDPNLYIDEIDWNCTVDQELLADLDRALLHSDDDDEKEEKSVLIGDSVFFLNQLVPCSGWGDDAKEDLARIEDNTADNHWECGCAAWGNLLDNNTTWGDTRGSSLLKKKNTNNWENPKPNGINASWGNISRYSGGPISHHGSREAGNLWSWEKKNTNNWENPKSSRINASWGNVSRYSCGPISHCGSREASNLWSWEKKNTNNWENPKPSRINASWGNVSRYSCGPISHRGSREAGNLWSWENSVA